MQSLGEGPGQLKDTPRTPGNIITREMRLVEGPTDGPPIAIWGPFKDYLIEQHSGKDIRELLLGSNIKSSWIDRFLKFYPELDMQSFLPVLNWILPQAFGQQIPTSFVFGQILNTDHNGSPSFVRGVKVCAYDNFVSQFPHLGSNV